MNPFTSSEQPSPESQRAAQSEDSIDVSSDILMQPLPPNYAEPADQSGGGGGLELQAATSNVREFGRAEDAGLETMEQENRASLVSNASVRLSPAAMSNSLSRSAPDAGRERYATTNWQTTSYEESSDGNFLVERSRSNLASSMVLPTNSNMSASNQESLDFNDCAQCHGHSADTVSISDLGLLFLLPQNAKTYKLIAVSCRLTPICFFCLPDQSSLWPQPSLHGLCIGIPRRRWSAAVQPLPATIYTRDYPIKRARPYMCGMR
jgi:hypothetical protein